MEINSEIQHHDYEIKIVGEVDASSAIILDEEFDKALKSTCKNILIDCIGMTYISSAGLGVFMSHIEDCNESGKKFVLFNMSEKILSVFDMLGLNNLITITKDKSEAFKYLNG